MFLVALLLRLAMMFVLDTPQGAYARSTWYWGHEQACVAQAIAEGRGLADPWCQGTGVSAWLTPVYPMVLAVCMEAFGVGAEVPTAAALFTLQSIVSAATCVLLGLLGVALGRNRSARLAAWSFAFFPASIWNAVHTVWDTTFVACGLLAFFVATLRTGRGSSPARMLQLGLGFGCLLLLNPAPIAVLPPLLLFLAPGGSLGRAAGRVAAFGMGAALVCAPWIIRNATELGTYGLRSNLGVELRVGNNDLADGRHKTAYHPSDAPAELERYQEVGEVEYSEWSMRQALAWILDQPRRFSDLTLRRIQIFWVGEVPHADPRTEGGLTAAHDPNAWVKWAAHMLTGALALIALATFARGKPEGLLLRGSLLLFPVPYFITHVSERYRFPIDPLLVFLNAYLVIAVWDRGRARWSRSGAECRRRRP